MNDPMGSPLLGKRAFASACSIGQGMSIICTPCWKFVISTSFELTAVQCLANSTPLFEEERNTSLTAIIPDRQDPFFLHGACSIPALAADYNPRYSMQVKRAQVLKERLNR